MTIPDGTSGQGITVTDSVTQFASFGANPTHVFATIHTANVWVTFDGTDPVAGANGHQLVPGDSLDLSKAMAAKAKFVRETSTSGFVYATPLA